MPLHEKILIGLVFFAVSAILWQGIKDGFRAYRERHSTWIRFDDLREAQEAANMVDRYYVSLDNGKRSEGRVVWLHTNAAVEILVPHAMLNMSNLTTAEDRFRNQVRELVKESAND